MKKATLACLAALIAAPSAWASSPCFTPTEHRATMVRQLQTELMVAALKCAGHPADLASRYNAFIRRFGSEISQNADVLRGYFRRAYGSGHARKMDSFVTTLANDAVMRTIGENGFCDAMAPVFDEVLSMDGKDLEAYAARTVTPRDTIAMCAKN